MEGEFRKYPVIIYEADLCHDLIVNSSSDANIIQYYSISEYGQFLALISEHYQCLLFTENSDLQFLVNLKNKIDKIQCDCKLILIADIKINSLISNYYSAGIDEILFKEGNNTKNIKIEISSAITKYLSKRNKRSLGEISFADFCPLIESPIIVTDPNFRIISWNHSAETVYKWDKDDVLDKRFDRITGINLNDHLGIDIFRKLAKNGYWKGELKQTNAIGELLTINAAIKKLDPGQFGGVSYLFQCHDISEIKRMSNALKDSEELYRTLIHNAGEGIILYDGDEIINCNQKATDILKCSKSDLIGSNPAVFSPQYQSDGSHSETKIKEYVIKALNGETQRFEWKYNRFDGTIIDTELSLSRVLVSGKKLVMAIINDISNRKKTELALNQNQDRLKMLMENTGHVLLMYDISGNMLYINGAEKFGLNVENIYGKTIFDLFDSKTCRTFKEQIERMKQNPGNFNNEIEIDWGIDIIWFKEYIYPIKSPSGELYAIGKIIQNISEKVEAEKALIESERKYKELTDQLPQVIYEIDLEGRFKYVNKRGYEFTGYTPEEVKSLTAYDMFIPEDKEKIINSLKRIMAGDEIGGNEYTAKRKDGSTFPILAYSNRLLRDGKVSGFSGFLIDITEIKKTERALFEAEEKMRSFIESVDDIVYFQSLDHKITLLNDTFERITGYSQQDFINNPRLREEILHPDDFKLINDFMERNPKGAPVFENIYRLKNKYGKWKWMQSKMIGIKNSQGNYIGYNCIDRDITEYKEMMDEIQDLNEDLEQRVAERTKQLENILDDLQNEIEIRKETEEELKRVQENISRAYSQEKELSELKTRFISMISHEYRTPLTVILTTTYLLEQLFKGDNKDIFRNHLEKIRISVNNMTKLLENVLTIGKSESGKFDVKHRIIDIVKFGRDIVEEIKIVDKNKHNFIILSNNEKTVISTDDKHLRQIFTNLLSNAAKYSPDGTNINLDIHENNDKVIVKFIDNGIGITHEDRVHLFEAFHRGKNVGNVSGTGLGLSIVKRCTDALNGNITLDSVIDKGTTFTLTLPRLS